jgi:integrase
VFFMEKKAKSPPRRMVFTDRNVWSLSARKHHYMIWDGGNGRGSGEVTRGLGIMVSPLGTKTYMSMFYFPGSGKSFTRKLGRVGQMTLEEARDQCRLDRRNADKGIDPRVRSCPNGVETYASAVDDYINRYQIGEHKNVSANGARKVLLNNCQDWHHSFLSTIQAKDIQKRLDEVRDGDAKRGTKGRPYLANLLHARLRTFFAWCAKPGIEKLPSSPMLGIGKPFAHAQRRERDWFAGTSGDQAIKALWKAADTIGGVEGQYLKVMLLTGKRKTALAEMRWEQIDQGWYWHAPGGRKKKRLHGVPLSSLIQRIIHPRQDSGYVFPGRRGNRIDVREALTTRIIDAGAPSDFFLHGVRHIAETKLAELKVARHIRDRLFDHVDDRGSGKTYDHHEYEDEMRDAVERWASHIVKLVSPVGAERLR